MTTDNTDNNVRLAILMLRSIRLSQDYIAEVLHCGKLKIIGTEQWVEDHSYKEVKELCQDQAIKCVFWLDIIPTKKLSDEEIAKVAQLNSEHILRHYDKVTSKSKQPLFMHPTLQQHWAHLADTAEKLRQNIKAVIEADGKFEGNITFGEIKAGSEGQTEVIKLENVDRLYATCLLEHLHQTYPKNKNVQDVKNWQNYDTKQKISELKDQIYDIIKGASHGIPILGRCHICETYECD